MLAERVLAERQRVVPAARLPVHGGVYREVGEGGARKIVRLRDADRLGDAAEDGAEQPVLVAEESVWVGDQPGREGVCRDAAAPPPPRRLGHEEHVAQLGVLVRLVGVVCPSVDHCERPPARKSLELAEARPLLGAALSAPAAGRVVHPRRRHEQPRLERALRERRLQQSREGKVADVVRADRELVPVRGELLGRIAHVQA
mmetsp:Transcript_29914/g.88943  ORF Transcript_29914/g.88943 Transcript_29914/m.88943 type:complete len:201 (-) Transcript_29914:611-1213(-)